MTPPDSFTTSGSSPPVDDPDVPSLPPELVEALASLLAEAIVADIRQFPNLAELQPNHAPAVESPSGLNHNVACPAARTTIAAPGVDDTDHGSDRKTHAGVIAIDPPPASRNSHPRKTRGSGAPRMVVRHRAEIQEFRRPS